MSGMIQQEASLFGASFGLGVFLMILYDGLRLFRRLVPHGVLWTGAEDMFYWLCSGFSTFYLLFEQNDGVLRAYAVGGVFAGMLAYNGTASRIFLKVLKKAEKYFTIKRRKNGEDSDGRTETESAAGWRTKEKE